MPALPFKFLCRPCALLIWGVSLVFYVTAQQLPIKSYTTSEGLPHNTVNRIVKDARGFLWFCTDDGLARFDGDTFTTYNLEQGLPHRTVNDFLETRTGEYWLATNGGLVRFNPQGVPMARVVNANETTHPAPMFTVVLPTDTDRLARTFTVLLESRDGTLWCGAQKYLYRLDRRGSRLELVPSEVGIGEAPKQVQTLDLLEDRQGSLWVASFNGLFRRRPDGGVERYTKHEGLPDNNLHDLLEDAQGRLWISTRLNGFFRLAAHDRYARPVVAEAYNRQNGLPTNWVFQLYQTSDHRFWVATNKGLIEFFPDAAPARRFRTYTRRNGLSHQEISTLGEDTGENLWLGTQTTGAMKLVRNGFISYGEADGLVAVNAIFEDATGRVCFRGSVQGDQRRSAFDGAKLDLQRAGADEFYARLGCFDGQHFDWFRPKAPSDYGWGYEQNPVRTRAGEWWLGTGAGLYRFPASDDFTSLKTARPVAIYTTKDGLASPQVFRVFADSGGNVWVSAFGLARWERASQTMRDLAGAPNLPPLKDTLVRSFAEDRVGNIWIGFNTGVARYHAGQFAFFSTSKELPLGGIMDILADRAGRLWLASSRSGLIYLDDPTAEQPAFKRYMTAQGLSSDSTMVLTEDDYGRIYIATGRGLDQLEPATGRFKHYTTADGLAPGNVIAAFCDHSGTLWFGTHRGLSRFVPEAVKTAPPPPILVTALNVAGERRSVSAFGETDLALAALASDRNQLQIDFVALGFAPGEVLRYQYQLEGSDTAWSSLSTQRTVNYASLAPGRYRFQVRAVNADGIGSANPATVSFTILRPIWQRWWFLTLVAALTGLMAVTLYRYRVARLLELERMRTRIATDLHDDIGAGLSRVAILSEVVKRQVAGSAEQSLPLLNEIADRRERWSKVCARSFGRLTRAAMNWAIWSRACGNSLRTCSTRKASTGSSMRRLNWNNSNSTPNNAATSS